MRNNAWERGHISKGYHRETCRHTISYFNDFQQSMGLGDFPLARNSKQCEENNHGTAAGCKPEWPRNSVVVSHKTGSKNCSGPEPRLEMVVLVGRLPSWGCTEAIKPTDTTAEVVKPVLTRRLAVINLNIVHQQSGTARDVFRKPTFLFSCCPLQLWTSRPSWRVSFLSWLHISNCPHSYFRALESLSIIVPNAKRSPIATITTYPTAWDRGGSTAATAPPPSSRRDNVIADWL